VEVHAEVGVVDHQSVRPPAASRRDDHVGLGRGVDETADGGGCQEREIRGDDAERVIATEAGVHGCRERAVVDGHRGVGHLDRRRRHDFGVVAGLATGVEHVPKHRSRERRPLVRIENPVEAGFGPRRLERDEKSHYPSGSSGPCWERQ